MKRRDRRAEPATRPLNLRHRHLGAVLVAVIGCWALAGRTTVWDACFALAPAGSAVAVVVAVHRYRPRYRLGWWLWTASLALFTLSDVLVSTIPRLLHQPPGAVQTLLPTILGYTFLSLALVVFAVSRGGGRGAGVDATIGGAVVLWYVEYRTLLVSSSPMTDTIPGLVLLLTVNLFGLVFFAFTGGLRTRSARLLGGSLTLWLLVNVASGVSLVSGRCCTPAGR